MVNRIFKTSSQARCINCEQPFKKERWAFSHAGSAYKNKIHWRGMCISCQFEQIIDMYEHTDDKAKMMDRMLEAMVRMGGGSKYLKKKVYEKYRDKIVAEKV